MNFSINDFKLYCFQEEYIKYNKILCNMQNHIHKLFKNNILSISDRNLRLSNIYDIICKINVLKEKYLFILYNDDSDNSESETPEDSILINTINNILKQLVVDISINDINSEENYKLLYDYLCSLYKLPSNTYLILDNKMERISTLLNEKILYPLYVIKTDILEFASFCGLYNLNDIFTVYNINYPDNINSINNKLINMYSNIYVPISVNQLSLYVLSSDDIESIENNKDFYTKNIFIKQNTDGNHDELLDNYYSLYINLNNKWLKINGFFKLDSLQIDVRLMSLTSYEKINERKTKIEKMLLDNDKFKRKYLKYCSIQELVTMSQSKFIKYLDAKYSKFNEINNKSFPSLMKEFIGKTMNLISWYEIIKLLLLGSDENVNIAGSLYSLLKDKKTNISLVPDIIYDNLVFCSQMKLKKINQTLKIELDKLNELNFESIDLKKELARSTHIPLYIRSLAMEKINEMKLNNNDYNKQLTFVKTILQFPWPSNNDENIFHNLNTSKKEAKNFLVNVDNKLDKITYGHKKVKEQISLLITKWISNPNSSGSAISLVGPPGVGKTLIAKSLSQVLDIPMVMITLGGQNDSELLIGHGYTYSGAQPGMIIKKMCEAGRGRCIMYFDELDKSCAKHGAINEITSILIHLTDPNTNKTFQDRFFQGVDFPLDKVIFIASYNDSNKIDPILLDRLIELEVKPYNIEDKINILRDFIIPELKKNIGISKNISFNEIDMKSFIYNFTAESGVRDLKHKMEQVLLNINKQELFNEKEDNNIILTYDLIVKYLGDKNKHHYKMVPEVNTIGHINGLYATSNGGGGITSIEICPMKISDNNNFQLKLTGSMGDVMKESIQVAFTRACNYISDNKDKYNIKDINAHIKEKFPYGFHIHTPEGATPKDGPSAGTAFTIGFISAILERCTNRHVAMTGEMNLSGHVTKIGGLVYKLIGAKYAGVKIALVPKQNEVDINEIKTTHVELFDNTFKYEYIENMDDVVKHVLL
jgi:endopeptidase La